MLLSLDDKSRLCIPREMIRFPGSQFGRWVIICPKDGILEVKPSSHRTPDDIVREVQYLSYKKWLTISDEMLYHLHASKDTVFELYVTDKTLYIQKWEPNKKTDA